MSGLFYMYWTEPWVIAWIGLASCSYYFSIELTLGNLVLSYLNFGMGEDCGFGFWFQNILTQDSPSSSPYPNNLLVSDFP